MTPFNKMDSKTVLFVCCVLATVLLVHCDEPRRQQPRPGAGSRSTLRYKRMYVMCPPKFSRIGNECYYLSPNKLNWLDAYFECKDHNSKLAEPMKYEDKHLRRYLQKVKHLEDLWIGGTYNWKANKWQWGHNGREMDYQSFSQMVPGSSRDLKYNCALLRADQKFRWSAEECTKKLNFICQHRMPLVSEMSRNQVYSRWNETFPNQQANEKMVYIVNDPSSNRTRSDPGRVRIYNSMKQVFHSNPSIQPRPAPHRRKPNRARKTTPAPSSRPEYIPSDVVYRKQQIAQYAPDAQNELNSIDNGHQHRNGYSSPRFNVDFGSRYSKNRDASFPRNGHRAGQVRLPEAQQPHQHLHQHRHQSGLYNGAPRKTTKHMQHASPKHPFFPAIVSSTASTTTTTTTTTTTPAPTTTTRRPTTTTTETESYNTELPTGAAKPSHSLMDEKQLHRARLRERLQKLTPEEQQFFFQDRARRKRLKEQQLRKLQEQQQDNEVVHE